jgi:hypothetical protein
MERAMGRTKTHALKDTLSTLAPKELKEMKNTKIILVIRFTLLVLLLGCVTTLCAAGAPLRLAIIGDSTVCEYPPDHACRGWGHYIQDYFKDTVRVINLNASSGRLYEQLGSAANDVVASTPEDRTHFNENGARMMAHLVMQELAQVEPRLAKELSPGGPAALGEIADKPLFRDPVYDGAADPVLCWNHAEKKWFMFYTNRRANAPDTPGVSWVHGTKIGIAESSDGGATWKYRGTANINYGRGEYSYWAPEVIEHGGTYHMYLTFVPGMHTDWSGTRDIIHLTSKDLLNWKYESMLKLSSNRVIDACVMRLPDGSWRMWYNNEVDRKSIYYADSPDLYEWDDKGKAMGDRPGEGPKVFYWKGSYWMVVDVWKGLGIYKSQDCLKWTRQANNLLEEPGQGPDDKVKGGHPDVVVSGGRAYLFYFTHPGRQNPNEKEDAYEQRRSSIQVVELESKDAWLSCRRDEPTYINLQPATDTSK